MLCQMRHPPNFRNLRRQAILQVRFEFVYAWYSHISSQIVIVKHTFRKDFYSFPSPSPSLYVASACAQRHKKPCMPIPHPYPLSMITLVPRLVIELRCGWGIGRVATCPPHPKSLMFASVSPMRLLVSRNYTRRIFLSFRKIMRIILKSQLGSFHFQMG